MARLLLTDDEWELIADVFPEPAATGRPRRDPRQVLDGILWVLRTGSPWRDVPEEFGTCKTCWRMFDTWDAGGDSAPLAGAVRNRGGDRRAVVVHRRHDGAGGPLRDRRRKKRDPEEPDDHALGRSRGGFTTKIHILCDGHGLPLTFRLTAGQTHESQALVDLMAAADDRLLDEQGERVAWPFALGGDKGYRADWIDQFLLELEITPVIPSKEDQDRDARLVDFDKQAYRRRNIIERLIGWLKESRRIFSRFEKTAKNFGGMITLAFIRQYLQYELV